MRLGRPGRLGGDAFVVLHRGELVYEWYEQHVRPDRPHLIMSVSKSLTSTLLGSLIGDGLGHVAVTGVALGVAVLVIVTSVMGGFGYEIRRMIVQTEGEVQVKAIGTSVARYWKGANNWGANGNRNPFRLDVNDNLRSSFINPTASGTMRSTRPQ